VLICDRDAKWSATVREWLEEAGIRVVQTPHHAPNANAYAERFVRSHRLIPLGEQHFRRAVTEFVAHDHRERNHQGLENRLIETTPQSMLVESINSNAWVDCSVITGAPRN
jgi:transposase InsO family protein